MTTQTEALKMALEALEHCQNWLLADCAAANDATNAIAAIKEALAAPQGEPVTGWNDGLNQDYDRKLGAWFASRPNAKQEVREAHPAPAPQGDREPNDDEVICPNCTTQFRAIPVNVQKLMLDAGFEPPFTAAPQGEPEKCHKCHGLGYYDEGHENDDGSMSGGNYVDCECQKSKSAEISKLHTVMMAAAVEITEHWDAHCDSEGYGPANLVRRLENCYPAQYGYDAQTVVRMEKRIEELEKECFKLAAGQCIHDDGLTGDDGGTPYCAIKRKLDTLVKKNPPVAYYDISHDEDGEVEYEFSVYPRKQFKPLYATQQPDPAPAPLSDEQIAEIVDRNWGSAWDAKAFVPLVREIERHVRGV